MFGINHKINLEDIYWLLKETNVKVNILMATIQDVQNAVANEATVDQSIVTLLQNIVQQLKDAQASGDPAQLDAVVASIQANTKVLSDAVTANTPAT